jgi:hypothetical protein
VFRSSFARIALALVCLSPLAACATAEQGALGGDAASDFGGSGGSSEGGTGTGLGGANRGGSVGTSGSNGVSGATSTAGSAGTGTAHGGTGGSGGTSTGGGASHAGTSSGGTSSAGTAGSAGTGSGGTSSAGTTGSAGTMGMAGSGAGGLSGTVLFSDDFEDGLTDKWVTSGGTWAIATDGTKVYAQTATGTGSNLLVSAAGSTAWTDQIVEAKIKITAFGGQSTSYFAGIFARYNGSTYYSVLLRSDGKLVIRDGTSSITNAVAASIVTGTTYTVRFELVGSSLKAYLNGVLQASVTDATHTSGGVAIATVNATAEFDDIKVTAP